FILFFKDIAIDALLPSGLEYINLNNITFISVMTVIVLI
ncbi:MAG: hypothetical protein ACJAVA_002723, partial [Flavobacteriaceae bacterium]